MKKFEVFLKRENLQNSIQKIYYPAKVLILETNLSIVEKTILPYPDIIFISIRTHLPQTELAYNGLDLRINQVNRVHEDFPIDEDQENIVNIHGKFCYLC